MAELERRDAIVVDRISKVYRVYTSPFDRLRRAVGLGGRFIEFRALHEVELRVRAGEAVGIIGENGAGKSTLLKIISGTTAASSGQVTVEGRITSILELGAGFHQEFSGRENAMMYGAIMGIGREQMALRLSAIIDFAELGSFIDFPVKVYSTGMVMRLAFAVATHVDADVLVVDEALAVGDGYFQKKCIDRILEIKKAGATVLFCSHATYQISMFCDRVVWLRKGRVERQGDAATVIGAYETHLLHRDKGRLGAAGPVADSGKEKEPGTVGLKVGRFSAIRVSGERDDGDILLAPHDSLSVELEVESTRPSELYHVGLSLDAPDGMCLFAVSTQWDGRQPLSGRDRYLVRLTVPDLPAVSGRYYFYIFLLDESGLHVHDQVVYEEMIRVVNPRWVAAIIDVPHSWEVE